MRLVAPQTLKQAGIVEVHQANIIAIGNVNAAEGTGANTLDRRPINNSVLRALHPRIEDIVPGRRHTHRVRTGKNKVVVHRLVRVHPLIMIMDIDVTIPVMMGEMGGMIDVMGLPRV
jgi:hypothetical protein